MIAPEWASAPRRAELRLLFVVHQFLPRHRAGTELYTYYLAREMVARGHQVCLYFTEIYPDRPQYQIRRGMYEGLPFIEVVHSHYFPSFRHTYRDETMEEIFEQVLEETKPDLVHFQHLYLHSVGYVEVARRHQLPIVYTLHEYILMCLRGGQLLLPDLSLCSGPENTACARCAHMYPPPGADEPAPSDGTTDPYIPAVALRTREIAEQLESVDLFISPSAFLRDRFVGQGMIEPERILFSDNGFPAELFENVQREEEERWPRGALRFGFVGTIGEAKGLHLLVEAFRGLDNSRATCQAHGDLGMFPDYKERLEAQPGFERIHWAGPFDHSRIGEVLAGIDVLIVPSLWYENSPLTIHEAFLAEVPVLTVDRGGMAELVEDGRNGLHFRMGDAEDLQRKMRRFLEEPELLAHLRRGFPRLKTISEDAETMEGRYRQLLRGEIPTA